MWGLMWGYRENLLRPAREHLVTQTSRVPACRVFPARDLDQAQLNCSPDSRPAAIDVEFAIDALRVGANGT
jgi:hypothetical protein